MIEFSWMHRLTILLLILHAVLFESGVRRRVAACGCSEDRHTTKAAPAPSPPSERSRSGDESPHSRSQDDHVGKPVPEFMSGDECLFCHRQEIGTTWETNRHGRTLRRVDLESESLKELLKSPATRSVAAKIEFTIGAANRQRFLKQGKAQGFLDLLTTQWIPSRSGVPGKIVGDQPTWDDRKFTQECAGCHATAVDSRTGAFAALSLDCYVCHGVIPEKHTTEPALAFFSKKRKEDARTAVSICGQCHIRTGTAKSTGRPYPNNFVAGDNLFRDFVVDFSDEQIARLNPTDAHILANVRDVVVGGQAQVTCLSCHSVHQPSGAKHHRVVNSTLCSHCHEPGSKKQRKAYEVHSTRCGY